jgi:hypothetical protein
MFILLPRGRLSVPAYLYVRRRPNASLKHRRVFPHSSQCRACSGTVAVQECGSARPAQAGHGGPADTAFNSKPVAAAQRLGSRLRSNMATHEREAKYSAARPATWHSAATKTTKTKSARLSGHRGSRSGHRCRLHGVQPQSPVPFVKLAPRQLRSPRAHASNGA